MFQMKNLLMSLTLLMVFVGSNANASSTRFGLLKQTYNKLVKLYTGKGSVGRLELFRAENRLKKMITYNRRKDSYLYDLTDGLNVSNKVSVKLETEIGMQMQIRVTDESGDGLQLLSRFELEDIVTKNTKHLDDFKYTIRSHNLGERESFVLVMGDSDAKVLIDGLKTEYKDALANIIFDVRKSIEEYHYGLDFLL
jgi:hypothetical protein